MDYRATHDRIVGHLAEIEALPTGPWVLADGQRWGSRPTVTRLVGGSPASDLVHMLTSGPPRRLSGVTRLYQGKIEELDQDHRRTLSE